MKNVLTSQEKLKVISIYWDATMFVTRYSPREFKVLDMIPELESEILDYDSENIDKYKLLLTRLKDISDEHDFEIATIVYGKGDWAIGVGKEVVKKLYDNKTLFSAAPKWFFVHQYLIQKSYAVPLFFGVEHLANGKTAIELGIAIDKNKQ